MKKFNLLLLSSLLFSSSLLLKAQQLTYSEVLIDSLQNGISSNAIAPTPDNGVVIVGSQSYSSFLRLDAIGNINQERSFYDSTNLYLSAAFNSILSLKEDGYFIGGNIYNSVSNKFEALGVKLNANGDTVWAKTINPNNLDVNIINVQLTSDSGFVMLGSKGGFEAIFIAKLNKFGNLQWTNMLGGTANSYFGSSVKQTPDGGYIITGNLAVYQPYTSYTLLFKLSPTGSLLWAKKYQLDASNSGSGNDVVVVNNGLLCYAYMDYNVVMLKTDSSGNLLGSKIYNTPSQGLSMSVTRPRLHATSDSSFVFISGGDWGNGFSKTDQHGNISWSRTLMMLVNDVTETTDHGYLVAGNGPMLGVKNIQFHPPQIGIVKTDSTGNGVDCYFLANVDSIVGVVSASPVPLTSSFGGTASNIHLSYSPLIINPHPGCVDVDGGINSIGKKDGISVYPNPNTGVFTLNARENIKSTVLIYNAFGQKIMEETINGNNLTLDLSAQPDGIYFFRILCIDGVKKDGKIVVSKK